MLLLVLTSYLFVQGPRLSACGIFLSPNAVSRFRPFSVVLPTRPCFRVLQKKKFMKKVITHNFKTLSV